MVIQDVGGAPGGRSHGGAIGDDREVADIMLDLERAVGLVDPLIGLAADVPGGGDAGGLGIDALVTLPLGSIGEVNGGEAPADAGHHVGGTIGDGAPVARGHIAIGVIAIAGVLAA